MITKHDLDAAIAECQGKRDPDANTCIKLAAFYTIRKEMYGEEKDAGNSYSYAPAPVEAVTYSGESDFAKAIHGRESGDVWPVMEELMDTLQAIQPRLYNAVMRKLNPD